MAAVGTNQLKSFQFLARVQQEEPCRREIRNHRHRQQAQPAGNHQRAALGHGPGARYVVQGNGSARRLAIMDDGWKRTTPATPARKWCTLNYAAVDPDLTNSKCSYWHFRLDADTSMKMEA